MPVGLTSPEAFPSSAFPSALGSPLCVLTSLLTRTSQIVSGPPTPRSNGVDSKDSASKCSHILRFGVKASGCELWGPPRPAAAGRGLLAGPFQGT